jgi:hypothetical protein
VEPNEIADPVPIGLLGPWAVMAHSNGIAKLITEPWAPVTIRVHGYFPGLSIWAVSWQLGNEEVKRRGTDNTAAFVTR